VELLSQVDVATIYSRTHLQGSKNLVPMHTSSRKQEFDTHVGRSKPWVPFLIFVRTKPELGLISTNIGENKIKCYFFKKKKNGAGFLVVSICMVSTPKPELKSMALKQKMTRTRVN